MPTYMETKVDRSAAGGGYIHQLPVNGNLPLLHTHGLCAPPIPSHQPKAPRQSSVNLSVCQSVCQSVSPPAPLITYPPPPSPSLWLRWPASRPLATAWLRLEKGRDRRSGVCLMLYTRSPPPPPHYYIRRDRSGSAADSLARSFCLRCLVTLFLIYVLLALWSPPFCSVMDGRVGEERGGAD
ncbi:uncharacterized protein J3D65DRAFT_394133 [Phyllosticta citribraziliensis]|uniref:Uncharacterized protein n=1 Tax=Phyllosticta citribraziliensis TaxID=989973 RepID=A0ABR1LL42_9PEZI